MEIKMLSIETMRKMLEDRNLKKVSVLSGVSQATLYRIVAGSDPRASIAEKLSNYLEGKEKAD
jgi:predicted transcriptional regulator